ncbi:MAG: sugar phosphate isomerase/epimerase [bacterium]|nr:sugar phosphate isomerase/epimerase [bacterium]
MKIGVCGSPEQATVLAAAGFDYLEINVQSHLNPLASDDEFASMRAAIAASPLPCRAANCFLPKTFKLTGPRVDLPQLKHYVSVVCRRAREVGLSVIAFGSGAARAVPSDFPRATAWQQLLDFARMAGDLAAAHRLLIAVEPLNPRECNILTSIAETAEFLHQAAHPALRLLVDAYHWHAANEPSETIVASAPLLAHVHLATYKQRLFPGEEPCDFLPFISALRRAKYNARISVEAKWNNTAESAIRAALILRHLLTSLNHS